MAKKEVVRVAVKEQPRVVDVEPEEAEFDDELFDGLEAMKD